jgi:transcriptional regulator with XRE-family HTH domain
MEADMSVFGRRMREARQRAGLSLEALAALAGLEEAAGVRARLSRYELGRREPDFALVARIAAVLGVPAAHFYAEDDDMAELIAMWPKLKRADRRQVIDAAVQLAGTR